MLFVTYKDMYKFLHNLNSSEVFSVKLFILLVTHLVRTSDGFSRREFTDKLFWLDHHKQVSFPRGIKVTLTPKVEVTLWEALNDAVKSTMSFDFPISVELDKLQLQDPLIQKRNSIIPLQPRYNSKEYMTRSKRHVGNNTVSEDDSYCTLGQQQKINILKKLEGILGTVGMNGGPCLLRAICEFQEFNSVENYGLLGEITKLLFSMKDKEGQCQNDFITAEERGRRYRCSDYRKQCSKSLFTWKTNYLPFFSGVLQN